mmetsp:Transcript_54016/g.101318  ORF Transcript_54016/g.101318 Transcript_54016/m.101318 type:complete len:206 (-) Transcript_54016:80-697(-)
MRRRLGSLLVLAASGPLHLSRPKSLVGFRNFAVMAPTTITVLTTEDAPEKAQKIVEASKALDAEASIEEVKSYYWWEGKVNFDPEWRVAVTTSAPFEKAEEVISKAHSYDLPMIIYNVPEPASDLPYWKGIMPLAEAEGIKVAEKLVAQRIVACAQASSTSLAVKTVARCKSLVEKQAGVAVEWSCISGNAGYLKWLEDECVGVE